MPWLSRFSMTHTNPESIKNFTYLLSCNNLACAYALHLFIYVSCWFLFPPFSKSKRYVWSQVRNEHLRLRKPDSRVLKLLDYAHSNWIALISTRKFYQILEGFCLHTNSDSVLLEVEHILHICKSKSTVAITLVKIKFGSKSYYLQIFKKNPIDLCSLYAFFI